MIFPAKEGAIEEEYYFAEYTAAERELGIHMQSLFFVSSCPAGHTMVSLFEFGTGNIPDVSSATDPALRHCAAAASWPPDNCFPHLLIAINKSYKTLSWGRPCT